MRERLCKRTRGAHRPALLAGMSLILCLLCLPRVSWAASERPVRVTLPAFPVTVNGVTVENSYRQYPVIVYGDITYFPMTYYDCRVLGLETNWSRDGGLEINQTGVSSSWHDQRQSQKNDSLYTAVIPTFPVRVNNNIVQNEDETYPLLSFRGVTYFPITWEYAVNQFGWKYHFGGKDGLVIQSNNLPVHTVKLSMGKKRTHSDSGYLVTMAHGNYYYQGDGGAIYQAPVSDPDKSSKIYQIDHANLLEGFEELSNSDGNARLQFTTGLDATGATNYDLVFQEDGTVDDHSHSGFDQILYEGGIISAYHGIASGPGNLLYTKSGEGKKLGSKDLQYYGPLQVKDDWLYARFDAVSEGRKTQGLCRINLTTNESQVLAKQDAMSYQIVGDLVFYRGSDCNLYMLTEKDGSWQGQKLDVGTLTSYFEPVGGDSVLFFGVLEGGTTHLLCYTPGKGVNHINNSAALDNLTKSNGYIIATFQENKNSKYRTLVFDENGNQVFYSADLAKDPQVCDGTLLYVNSDGAVCTAPLSKSVPIS